MSQFILCDRTFYPDALESRCGLRVADLADQLCSPPKRIDPYTPYLVSGTGDANSQRIQTMLTRPQAKKIVELSNMCGADNVLALSTLFNRLSENLADDKSTAVIGATTDAYNNRAKNFSGSVKQYQNSLLIYRDAVKSESADIGIAKKSAEAAFSEMQSKFQIELSQIKSTAGSRGTPLNSLQRGLNIARDSRNITRLNLGSSLETSQLLRFTGYATALGNGVAIIDLASRIGNVRQSYASGGNWEREMFIESASLGASAGVGYMAGIAGAAALGFLVALTPLGWIGLIVVIAGVGYASYKTNEIVKRNAGTWFDKSQEILNR